MPITRDIVAEQLAATIQSWAHDAFNESEFEEADPEVIRDVVARLGLVADMAALALTWEDAVGMLARPHKCLTGQMA